MLVKFIAVIGIGLIALSPSDLKRFRTGTFMITDENGIHFTLVRKKRTQTERTIFGKCELDVHWSNDSTYYLFSPRTIIGKDVWRDFGTDSIKNVIREVRGDSCLVTSSSKQRELEVDFWMVKVK